jgi:hypothetical protein
MLNVILSLLLVVPLLAGCREDVVSVLGTDQPFTLWGVFNPLADTQFVRVFPIEGTLQAGEPVPLDARFTSTDLVTGEERIWRDSVRIDARSLVEHIYYAPFMAEYGRSYLLEIVGGDGRTSSVEVAVPARTELTLAPADTSGHVRLPVFVRNDPPNLIRSEVELSVSYVIGFSASGCPNYRYVEYVLPYDDLRRPTDDGWTFVVNLNEVYNEVQTITRNDESYLPQYGITLGFIRFNTVVASEAWVPPNDVFDPAVLVQPGTMENVENGFGFVGAGYRLSRGWSLPVSVIERVGFRTNFEGCP